MFKIAIFIFYFLPGLWVLTAMLAIPKETNNHAKNFWYYAIIIILVALTPVLNLAVLFYTMHKKRMEKHNDRSM